MRTAKQARRGLLALAIALLAPAAFAAPPAAGFGIEGSSLTFEEEDGSPMTQAGAHPFAMATRVDFNTSTDEEGKVAPEGATKDLFAELPEGFAGVPTATPRCTGKQFSELLFDKGEAPGPNCANSTAVGYIDVTGAFSPKPPGELTPIPAPVYSLTPPPGTLAKFGFVFAGVPIVFDVRLSEKPPYRVLASFHSTPQSLLLYGATLRIWGNPLADAHDAQRGRCLSTEAEDLCEVEGEGAPLITAPGSCAARPRVDFEGNSWGAPEVFIRAFAETEQSLSDCSALDFAPGISATPTTKSASSPSGLDFGLQVQNEGILDPHSYAASTIAKTVVTLPEGMSVNPSVAEGLEVCSEAQLARETAFSEAGTGCPNASKIGTAEVQSPVLEEKVGGTLYIAAPYENPFHTLIAMYLVLKNPQLGIKVVQPLRVEPDPVTGQLTTIAEDMPQLPFSDFKLHFREGARSPLASPSACGVYDAAATLYPWSGAEPVHTTSAFQIVTGPEGGSCPSGALPPFRPGLAAGTRSNAAGSFSPFDLRLWRSDAEQEITHFSIKLPPGVIGKLAGIPFCPDAAIAAAKARTGPHGGQEELDSPSCPAASEIGHTLVGSGVGQTLAYAPGKLYLAGPYHGSAISLVAITAGRVGPFDIGTVVIREAIKINPETAEVFIDATGSDPIPHIIKGLPVHLRDIRAYADRPEFVLNPTNCTRTSTASTLLGSGFDFGSETDDRPVTVSTSFQAADCAALPFKPRFSLRLKGGTGRGAFPALTARLAMNGIGEAGVASAQVTLPRSEFIANAHFNTICTRAQFNGGEVPGEKCPAGSIYGSVKAITPILSDPLEGPLFLRSSVHKLPDVVAALHSGEIDVVLVGRVDSVKGRLRTTFEATPDAPVSSVVVSLLGGKKGLFENSTDLCRGTHRAIAAFIGQNGKKHNFNPAVKASGCKAARKGKGAKRRRAA